MEGMEISPSSLVNTLSCDLHEHGVMMIDSFRDTLSSCTTSQFCALCSGSCGWLWGLPWTPAQTFERELSKAPCVFSFSYIFTWDKAIEEPTIEVTDREVFKRVGVTKERGKVGVRVPKNCLWGSLIYCLSSYLGNREVRGSIAQVSHSSIFTTLPYPRSYPT